MVTAGVAAVRGQGLHPAHWHAMVDAGILRAGFVLGTFMLLDLSKYWIGQLFGTHAVWSLTQDVRALRHHVNDAAITPRSHAHRPRARERLLRDKERQLLELTTPSTRRALFYSHYLSVLKGICGLIIGLTYWGEPLFSVQRASVWPCGRWLAVPHGHEWEAGAVGVAPWLVLSAAASVAMCDGLVGPAMNFCLSRAGWLDNFVLAGRSPRASHANEDTGADVFGGSKKTR